MVLRTLSHSILCVVLLLAAGPAAFPDGTAGRVRVLLTCFSASQPVTISGDGLQSIGPDQSWTPVTGAAVTLSPRQDAGGAPAGGAAAPVFRCTEGCVTVSQGARKRSYRGEIRVTVSGSRIALVNDVELEEYLRAVVPCEMPASFPAEALKAQAVAARSFAIANAGKHKALGADLCDSDDCQVYAGVAREQPATDSAVSATAGQVLMAAGKIIAAQYSSNCGGHTSPSGTLGERGAVADTDPWGKPWCACDSGQSWQCRATQAQVLAAAGERRKTPLRRLAITDRDVSGRARKLTLEHDFGKSELSANSLRLALGLSRMKSLLCTFSADPATGDILISGRGWGHGAGLCQWGAKGMATPPSNASYRQILAHYYATAELVVVKPEDLPASDATTRPSP